MAKYNIKAKKEKAATLSYKNTVTPAFVEDVAKRIITKLMIEGAYRNPKYSAKRLAADLDINMRQLSAVVSLRFQQNYSVLVGTMRILEAKYMLRDRSFDNMTIEDIATNVGFTTRQSFYMNFYKTCGTTPMDYRRQHGFAPKADTLPAHEESKEQGAKSKKREEKKQ